MLPLATCGPSRGSAEGGRGCTLSAGPPTEFSHKCCASEGAEKYMRTAPTYTAHRNDGRCTGRTAGILVLKCSNRLPDRPYQGAGRPTPPVQRLPERGASSETLNWSTNFRRRGSPAPSSFNWTLHEVAITGASWPGYGLTIT